jgi:hypothetical protein
VTGSNGEIFIMIGNGDGTFMDGVVYGGGPGSLATDIGDLNGDGWLDLAIANRKGFSVLLNTGVTGTGSLGASFD